MTTTYSLNISSQDEGIDSSTNVTTDNVEDLQRLLQLAGMHSDQPQAANPGYVSSADAQPANVAQVVQVDPATDMQNLRRMAGFGQESDCCPECGESPCCCGDEHEQEAMMYERAGMGKNLGTIHISQNKLVTPTRSNQKFVHIYDIKYPGGTQKIGVSTNKNGAMPSVGHILKQIQAGFYPLGGTPADSQYHQEMAAKIHQDIIDNFEPRKYRMYGEFGGPVPTKEDTMYENADHDYSENEELLDDEGNPIDVENYTYHGPKQAQRISHFGVDNSLSETLFDRIQQQWADFLAESEMSNEPGVMSPLTHPNRPDFDKDPTGGEEPVTDGTRSPMSNVKRQKVLQK